MVRAHIADVVNRYVAVWNESDPHVRRQSISELWAPDGATYHRFIDARGREAVEARVAGSWVKWVQTNGYVFRSRQNVRAHHDVVAFNWEMVPAGGGEVAAVGLEFLVLTGENLIRFVYQFNDPPAPATDEINALAERYVALWNESDLGMRRRRVAELWAQEGVWMSESATCSGHTAIEEAIRTACERALNGRFAFSARNIDGHHNVIRLDIEIRRRDAGEPSPVAAVFLVLDEGRRIRFDYEFADTGVEPRDTKLLSYVPDPPA
jgi:hypothetical protein